MKITTVRNSFILGLCVVLLAFTIIGCGSSSISTSGETGSIAAKLDWDKSLSDIHSAAAPSGVATVRIIVSGTGMTDMQKDFAASAGQGQIDGVPVGSNRTVTAQGLNSGGSLTHQGSISNVTVTAGQTTDVGTIVMLPLTPQNQGTVSGTVTNAAGAPVEGVTVTLSRQGSTVAAGTTGPDGKYGFTVPAGGYTIVFSKTGFQTSTSEIVIVAGSTLTTNAVAVTVSGTPTTTTTTTTTTIVTTTTTTTSTTTTTTPRLPAGFPANVPNGNYRLDLQVCAQPPQQALQCQPVFVGVQTVINEDINLFAQQLIDALNAAAAQAQPSCTQSGVICSFNITYTPWNGTSFTIVDNFTVTSASSTVTGTITYILTKI